MKNLNYQALNHQKTLNLQYNMENHLSSFTDTDFLFMRLLLTHANRFKAMYFRQDTLGKAVKRAQSTISESNTKLKRLGFTDSDRRPGAKSSVYYINEIFQQKEYLDLFYKYMRKHFNVFSLGLIAQAALVASPIQLLNKDFKKIIKSPTEIFNQTVFYENNNKYQDNSTENHPPNAKLSFEQFDLLLTTEPIPATVAISSEVDALREQVELLRFEAEINREMTESMMQDLTIEQLEELAQFPTETIKYAHKMLTKDMAAGKNIRNPFAYLMAICKAHIATNKNPQTGKPIDNRSGAKPLYAAPETVIETAFEWCMKIEPYLHEYTLSNHPGLKVTRSYADAQWDKLSLEEQQTLIDIYHQGCSCRKITAQGPVKTVVNKSWQQDDHVGKKQDQAKAMGIDITDKSYGELCREIAALRDQ